MRAIAFAEANRALPDGGSRHDEKDAAGPQPGDSIAMARAYLGLYGATGDRPLLAHAEETIPRRRGYFRPRCGIRWRTNGWSGGTRARGGC